MRSATQFWLDGEVVTLDGVDPTLTVLDWLRYRALRTGSKEGCAEGDCGACTVVIGELSAAGDSIKWRAVNACILFVPMLDGKALITVESLGGTHPVQQAMVDLHGSQCGFCTPGIVMSLYARSIGAAGTQGTAADTLAGNLCRCTGYGPILAAAEANPPARPDDIAVVAALRALPRDGLALGFDDALSGVRRRWFAPKTTNELADLLLQYPDARLIAGATDVGLWVTKQHRQLSDIISLGYISDLSEVTETQAGLKIGAAVRYTDAHDALAHLHSDLGELIRRIGGVQVRNSGTIGGNIANGSPIGDMPPALIALGAALTLRKGAERRTLPLEDYFLAYGKQDRQPGEFVESVFIPRPDPAAIVRIVKLSKRFDSDISAVCGGFNLGVSDGVVVFARVAFGGMAGTPKRASATEAALVGKSWSQATLDAAAEALKQDFTPLSDVRGSSEYRLTAAGNLLRRLWFEQAGQGGSVLDMEPING